MERVFDHVLIIMLENQYRSYVMRNSYMASLANKGVNLKYSYGVMHPSQTNYIASITGQLCGVVSDDPVPLAPPSIVDRLEAKGLSWKAYIEDYPNTQWQAWSSAQQPPSIGPNILRDNISATAYYRKHNAFASMSGIQASEKRWGKIQCQTSPNPAPDETVYNAFWDDVTAGRLPHFAWFTPNIWDDGHYLAGTASGTPKERAPILVDQSAAWLQVFFERLRFRPENDFRDSLLPPGTLVVVTFDEGDFEAAFQGTNSDYDGPNRIYTVLLGDWIRPARRIEGYNHYSLLKTIEVNFGLDSLGANDDAANWHQFLWGKSFGWPETTGALGDVRGPMALAGMGEDAWLVFAGDGGEIFCRRFSIDHGWTEAMPVGHACGGQLALAACADHLVLVYDRPDRPELAYLTYDGARGWSTESGFVASCRPRSCAMASFQNYAAPNYPAEGSCSPAWNVMLAYSTPEGPIESLVYDGKSWQLQPTAVGFQTDGALALSAIGPVLYLVYKQPGKAEMSFVTYNTAPYNVVSNEVQSTSRNTWGASSYPVALFYSAKSMTTPGEREPFDRPYTSAGNFACGQLSGEIHLVYADATADDLADTVFSLAGAMVPMYPTQSGEPSSAAAAYPGGGVNYGYGTAAETGWGPRALVRRTALRADGRIALATVREHLLLVWHDSASGGIGFRVGGYKSEVEVAIPAAASL